MVFKKNPNITERNAKALKVACSYCHAQAGEPCWALRSIKDEPTEAWKQKLKERKGK